MLPTQGNFFTEDQYKQLVNLLSKSSTSDCSTNATCIITLLSNATANDHIWIMDSGTTHHVTHCKDVLNNLRSKDNNINGVQPTRSKAEITHT